MKPMTLKLHIVLKATSTRQTNGSHFETCKEITTMMNTTTVKIFTNLGHHTPSQLNTERNYVELRYRHHLGISHGRHVETEIQYRPQHNFFTGNKYKPL